jgi:hypothetical protein
MRRLIKETEQLGAVLAEERANFKEILTEEREGRKEERRQFAALLKREENLFKRQEKISQATLDKVKEKEGELVPANLPSPYTHCDIPPGVLSLYFAGTVFSDMHYPFSVLRVADRDIISIDKDQNGGFLVSAKIFDDRSDIGLVSSKINSWPPMQRREQSKRKVVLWFMIAKTKGLYLFVLQTLTLSK